MRRPSIPTSGDSDDISAREPYAGIVKDALRRIADQTDENTSRVHELEKAVVELSTKLRLFGMACVVGVPFIVVLIQFVMWLATKSVQIHGSPAP